MPITFNCSCGKGLRAADEFAGRKVKCPACQAIVKVPEPEPAFEIIEEPAEQLAPAPVKARPVARPVAKPVASRDDDDEAPAKEKPDFRYGSGRTDDDDEDRPKKKQKKQKPPETTHRSLESRILHGGVGGGILAMVIAVVWFVIGLANDLLFYYPPILFIVGLVAFIKGLTSE